MTNDDAVARSVLVVCRFQWLVTLLSVIGAVGIVAIDAVDGVYDWRSFALVAGASAFHAWGSWFLRLAKADVR